MGFWNAGFMGVALGYLAFAYVAAQIINTARMRYEDLIELRTMGTTAVSSHRSLRDFHDGYALFLCINGWLIFCAAGSTAVLYWAQSRGVGGALLPDRDTMPVPLLWSLFYLVIVSTTHGIFRASRKKETDELGVTNPILRTWPTIRGR